MIGPIAHAYEYASSATPRLDDETAAAVAAIEDPWTRSYTVPAAPDPSFRAMPSYDDQGYLAIEIDAKQPLGQMTFEVLDHHRAPRGAGVTRTIGKGKTVVRLAKSTEEEPASMIHMRAGAFHAWVEMLCMDGCRSYGFGSERDRPPPEE